MINALMKLVSLMPISALHALGGVLGSLAYTFGGDYRRKMHENLRQAGLPDSLADSVKRNSGMQGLETAWVWKRSNADVLKHIEFDEAERNEIREVVASGRSIVVITPHVGCFEVCPIGLYELCFKEYGKKFTVLYREPKMDFLKPVVAMGRVREGMDPAPADLKGVRQIVKAMRSGGILGCLPDQVPGRGEGVWAPFFGRKAFTMTFPLKMIKQFDAVCFIGYGERIEGKGWKMHFRRWNAEMTGDFAKDAAALNAEIEKTIMSSPEQYIWNYNRYKTPRGMPDPD